MDVVVGGGEGRIAVVALIISLFINSRYVVEENSLLQVAINYMAEAKKHALPKPGYRLSINVLMSDCDCHLMGGTLKEPGPPRKFRI